VDGGVGRVGGGVRCGGWGVAGWRCWGPSGAGKSMALRVVAGLLPGAVGGACGWVGGDVTRVGAGPAGDRLPAAGSGAVART